VLSAIRQLGVHVTVAVYICMVLGVVLFVLGCLIRIFRYATMPVHLRWELYPVPHEQPARVAHGGSYFEDGDWWTKPRHVNRAGELRVMVPEIAFLKGLWEFNRGLWYTSFLFHLGLYLTIAAVVLAALKAALLGIASGSAGLTILWTLQSLQHILAYLAVPLTLIGAVGLLFRRLTDPALKNYTSPADLFNLHFFIVVYGVLAAGYLLRPESAAPVTRLLRGLVTFDVSLEVGRGFGVGLILASALLAYIPFTHMAHFIAKYFTYHQVRWDDRASIRGGQLEGKLVQCLQLKPTWAAPHMGADGKRTWAEIASANPAKGDRQ
jgi:nitrate reductase gamma subunit